MCAMSGECLNVANVYADERFNPNLDMKLGYRTVNMLCQPIRANRGGGRVVGVVAMSNKLGGAGSASSSSSSSVSAAGPSSSAGSGGVLNPSSSLSSGGSLVSVGGGLDTDSVASAGGSVEDMGEGFTQSDEALLASCVTAVADELESRFRSLLDVTSRWVGHSTLIGSQINRSSVEERYKEYQPPSVNFPSSLAGSVALDAKTLGMDRFSVSKRDEKAVYAEQEMRERREAYGRFVSRENKGGVGGDGTSDFGPQGSVAEGKGGAAGNVYAADGSKAVTFAEGS